MTCDVSTRHGTTRADWTVLERTRPSDRTSFSRTRRLLATHSLEERKKVATRHPDERCQYRKLLTDPDSLVPLTTRPRNGCCWGALGAALRQCDDRPTDRSCPYLLNESWDCFELDATFPEFCAVGARPLLPKVKNRLTFEVRTEPSARQHIVQVGIARVGGDASQKRSGCLDESTPLLESFVYSSVGDVLNSGGPLEIVAPGTLPGLRFRLENWCSGAPAWLSGGALLARVMIEVDLRRGRVSLNVGDWEADPLVLSIPGLVDADDGEKEWLPFISLTAVGQSARLLDFHARVDA